MPKVSIEFFHDVICSFCFPMSYRMRKIQQIFPDVEIIHRSYALVWKEEEFNLMFGTRQAAKNEILTHWEHANENDDLHRFNIEGMKKADFLFPTSVTGLLACKAGYYVAGQNGYWEIFDALQEALFVKNLNIGELSIVEEIVRGTSVDFGKWKEYYASGEVEKSVIEDFTLAKEYGITSVPSLIINKKYMLSGAQPLAKIVDAIENIEKSIEDDDFTSGGSCSLKDGKFNCE